MNIPICEGSNATSHLQAVARMALYGCESVRVSRVILHYVLYIHSQYPRLHIQVKDSPLCHRPNPSIGGPSFPRGLQVRCDSPGGFQRLRSSFRISSSDPGAHSPRFLTQRGGGTKPGCPTVDLKLPTAFRWARTITAKKITRLAETLYQVRACLPQMPRQQDLVM